MSRYTSRGIVYTLVIAKAALADLTAIEQEDPDTANDLLVLLQEIKNSQVLLDSLTVRDFGAEATERFHVDAWAAQQTQGRNIWRLKSWDLENRGIRYRVIYALDPRISRYFVLAILPRDFDYDPRHPRVVELLRSYDRLGIPAYR